MNKKVFGLIITTLILGGLIAYMVQSNLNKPEAINTIGKDITDFENGTNHPLGEVGLQQGDVPPDFELTTLDGETVRLSELRGKKVMLNFWASWCGPCKAEMPHMQNYYEENGDNDDFEMIAVNLSTTERQGMTAVKDFVEQYGLTFPILLDEDGAVGEAYEVISIPTTYMIDSVGTISQKVIGPMDGPMMDSLIQQLQ